jgi:uncharacterized protein YktA (UPF0223 family)
MNTVFRFLTFCIVVAVSISFFSCNSDINNQNSEIITGSAVGQNIMGLAINAYDPNLIPSEAELNDLCVKWVRSIHYQNPFTPHTTNVNWLVVLNQETLLWCRNPGISWNDYIVAFSDKAREIVAKNPWINAVEVWNEQDLQIGDINQDCRYLYPEEYAQLLEITYTKIKNQRSSVAVIVGGLVTGNGGEYLKQVRQYWRDNSDEDIYYDGIGTHPYFARVENLGANIELNKHVNEMYAIGGKPLWLTEFGASWQIFNAHDPVEGKRLQAEYLRSCYEVVQKYPTKVAAAFWFAWDDRTVGANPPESYGLVEMDHVTKRPSWYAYKEIAGGMPNPPLPPSQQDKGLPDLIVENVSWTPNQPGIGEDVHFNCRVKNIGSVATPADQAVGVGYTIDGIHQDFYWALLNEPLAPGQIFDNLPMEAIWTGDAGVHTVIAFVNDIERFPEADMNNNKQQGTFTIYKSIPPSTTSSQDLPDLIVEDVSWTPAQPEIGEQVRFNCRIKNIGSVATPADQAVGVGYTVDGVHTDFYWALLNEPLASGQIFDNLPMEAIWTGDAGAHTVIAFVNDIERFPEADMNNNKRQELFTINKSEQAQQTQQPEQTQQPQQTNLASRLHGTVYNAQTGEREANMYVSIWGQNDNILRTTHTDINGIYEFRNLTDQRYNMCVNMTFVTNGECGPYDRIELNRLADTRDNVQLFDGGDGWHGEDFPLTKMCP